MASGGSFFSVGIKSPVAEAGLTNAEITATTASMRRMDNPFPRKWVRIVGSPQKTRIDAIRIGGSNGDLCLHWALKLPILVSSRLPTHFGDDIHAVAPLCIDCAAFVRVPPCRTGIHDNRFQTRSSHHSAVRALSCI